MDFGELLDKVNEGIDRMIGFSAGTVPLKHIDEADPETARETKLEVLSDLAVSYDVTDDPDERAEIFAKMTEIQRQLDELGESKTLQESVSPVKVEIRQESKDVWVCPHCGEDILEKSMYDDGEQTYHRSCKGPLILPEMTEEQQVWLDRFAGRTQAEKDAAAHRQTADVSFTGQLTRAT